MTLDITQSLEAEILQRADAEGISASQFLDRLLHSGSTVHNGGASQPLVHSVDPANDTSIALLKARLAAAPTDPEAIQEAEQDLQEFMDHINAERKQAGARLVYPESA